jgi:hypothetical protein
MKLHRSSHATAFRLAPMQEYQGRSRFAVHHFHQPLAERIHKPLSHTVVLSMKSYMELFRQSCAVRVVHSDTEDFRQKFLGCRQNCRSCHISMSYICSMGDLRSQVDFQVL